MLGIIQYCIVWDTGKISTLGNPIQKEFYSYTLEGIREKRAELIRDGLKIIGVYECYK